MSDSLLNAEKKWRDQLNDHAADVPNDMFNRINAARLSDAVKTPLKDFESEVPDNMFDRIQIGIGQNNWKEKLNNFSSEIPNNAFDRVMSARAPENTRRPIFGWLGLCLLLFLLIGLVWTTSTLKKLPVLHYNNNELKQQTEILNSDKKDIVVSPDKNAVEISSLPDRENIKPEEKINRGAISATDAINIKKITLKENKIGSLSSSKINTKFGNSSVILSQPEKKTAPDKISNSKNSLHSFAEKNYSEKFSENNSKDNSEKISDNKINKPTKSTVDFESGKNSVIKNPEIISATTDTPVKFTLENNNFYAVNLLPLKTGFLIVKNKFVSPCKGPGDGCPTFNSGTHYNPNKGFFIDASAGPEMVMRKLTEKSLDFTDYRKARDTTEHAKYAFSVGVGFGYEFRNGIMLRTGVLYNELHETAIFDSLGVGKIEYTITKDPTTGLSDTSAQILTDGIFRKTRYNKYSDLNIPLQIGYDVVLKNNWSLLLKIGGGLNITAWRKADILGTDFKLLNQTGSTATSVFKNNIGGYVGGSIGIYKALDEHLLLGIEPCVRYYTSSFTQSGYPLNQTYLNFGINASARWKF